MQTHNAYDDVPLSEVRVPTPQVNEARRADKPYAKLPLKKLETIKPLNSVKKIRSEPVNETVELKFSESPKIP